MDANRTCPICGTSFAARRTNQVYCGATCRKKADAAIQKKWKERQKAPPQKHTRTCPICGGEFVTIVKDKVYCSESCKREEAKRRKKYGSAAPQPKAGENKRPGLIERYSAYRAAGGILSYGYWVVQGCPDATGQ